MRRGGYGRFAAVAVAATVVLLAIGFVPTRRLAGGEGVAAMFVACGIVLAASLLGALPVARAERARRDPAARQDEASRRDAASRRDEASRSAAEGSAPVVAALGAMAIRFVTVTAATVAVAVAGWAPVAPLMVWAAVGYLVLLLVDTLWAVEAVGARGARPGREETGPEGPRQHPGRRPPGTTETR